MPLQAVNDVEHQIFRAVTQASVSQQINENERWGNRVCQEFKIWKNHRTDWSWLKGGTPNHALKGRRNIKKTLRFKKLVVEEVSWSSLTNLTASSSSRRVQDCLCSPNVYRFAAPANAPVPEPATETVQLLALLILRPGMSDVA